MCQSKWIGNKCTNQFFVVRLLLKFLSHFFCNFSSPSMAGEEHIYEELDDPPFVPQCSPPAEDPDYYNC